MLSAARRSAHRDVAAKARMEAEARWSVLACRADREPPSATERQGHLALLKRWYYRPEVRRVGEICFPDEDGRWPIKAMLRGVGRVAAKAMAEAQPASVKSAENAAPERTPEQNQTPVTDTLARAGDPAQRPMVELLPSILSADFAHLADEVAAAERGGGTVIHVDVMDGHFVPNITLGPPVVKSLRKATKLPLDCHLMIENPNEFIPAFADAGADWVSVHYEACRAPAPVAGADRSPRHEAGGGAESGDAGGADRSTFCPWCTMC